MRRNLVLERILFLDPFKILIQTLKILAPPLVMGLPGDGYRIPLCYTYIEIFFTGTFSE
jgi:hypothetical protein